MTYAFDVTVTSQVRVYIEAESVHEAEEALVDAADSDPLYLVSSGEELGTCVSYEPTRETIRQSVAVSALS